MRHSPLSLSSLPVLLLTLLTLLPFSLAQFQFFQSSGGFPFGNPFGGGQEQQKQRPGRQYKGWSEAEGVHCRAGYVCPTSLHCVPTPADCPCSYPEDVLCRIPDPRPRDEGEGPPFVCVRGGDCSQVEEFSKPI